eukprot:COSAG05_NODE_982_length_6301_cov_14.971300_9_plen_80_part_00
MTLSAEAVRYLSDVGCEFLYVFSHCAAMLQDEDQSGILDRDEVGRAVSALCGGVELDDKQLNDAMEDMDRYYIMCITDT